MKWLYISTAFALILPGIILSGCLDESDGPTRIVKDMLGREVDVPSEVQRVVGIEAGALRLLVYMEQTDKVVGIEEHEKTAGPGGSAKPYTFANPGLLDLPSIGPMHGGDAELIVAADPDVVFWTSTEKSKADDLQEKTGIPVVGLEYGDLGDGRELFYEALRVVGEVCRNLDRVQGIKDFMEERITELDNMTEDLGPSPSCYVGGIGYKGSHGIQSTEPSYSSLEFVNGDNVASSLGLDHAFVDKEKIIDWDPDVILIDGGGAPIAMDELDGGIYDTVEAVKEGSIYAVLPYNWYTTNYGTVLGNSYYIAKVLFPDDLQELDPVEETNDIYEFLVGGRVYQQMSEEFGGYRELEV